MGVRRALTDLDRRLLAPLEPVPQGCTPMTDYAAALAEVSRVVAGVAAADLVLEAALAGHPALSVAFAAVGAVLGVLTGRRLAAQLAADWGPQAPLAGADVVERDGRPAPVVLLGFAAAAVGLLTLPLLLDLATPVPGTLAAAALQLRALSRAAAAVGRERGGRLLRPAGRLGWSPEELRLAPSPGGAQD